MLGIGVNETIARILMKILSWVEGDNIPTFFRVGGIMNKMITKAIENQTIIGWDKVQRE